MQKHLRTFFAIDIPPHIKKTIATAIKPWQKNHSWQKINWVKPKTFHITLCFLGKITPAQYQDFGPSVTTAIKAIDKFYLELTTLQPFPTAKNFQILSLKPQPITELTNLAHTIAQTVETCGIKTEKRSFKPHLTLGRIINPPNLSLLAASKFPAVSFETTKVKLFASMPNLTGSVYSPIAVYKLA